VQGKEEFTGSKRHYKKIKIDIAEKELTGNVRVLKRI
jgi:hypothetical protein